MKKIYYTSVFILIVSIASAQYSWINKNPFGGAARMKSASFTINGKGYIMGGRISTSPIVFGHDAWEYNPATDSWTSKLDYPMDITQPYYFAIGSKAYVTGGANASIQYQNATYEFDPVANTWASKAAFPENGGAGFQFVINGKGYAGAGARASNMSTNMYAYDPGTNVWTPKADFPGVGVANPVGFSFGNFGYAGLGSNGLGTEYDQFFKYNALTDTWDSMAAFPGKGRFGAVAIVVDGHAFVGGGARTVGGNLISLNDFYDYNPAANTWSPAPGLPGVPKSESGVFTIGNSGYLVNGHEYDGDIFYKAVYEFGLCSTISGLTQTPDIGARGLVVYPNPTSQQINIEIEGEMTSPIGYEVISIDGKVLASGTTQKNNFRVEANTLANGIYFFMIKENDGRTAVKKFEVIH